MQRRAQQRQGQMATEAVGETAATAAACAVANAACAAATAAMQARQQQQSDQYAAEDKPIHDRMQQQSQTLMAQGQAMQQDPRLMRLMQLVEEKHCH